MVVSLGLNDELLSLVLTVKVVFDERLVATLHPVQGQLAFSKPAVCDVVLALFFCELTLQCWRPPTLDE
jgi:hypothetical protein